MSKVRVERKIGNEILSFETGFIAKQADACIIAQYGETVVLSAISSGAGRPGLDFFQLMCDYREPGVIRVAPAPFYNSFDDVYRFVEILKEIV